MSPGWPSFSIACLRMTSICGDFLQWSLRTSNSSTIGSKAESSGRPGATPDVQPGVAKTERQRYDQEHLRDDSENDDVHVPAARHPGEHAGAANEIKRAEKNQQVVARVASFLERRQQRQRCADREAPDQLIVEPELAQRTQGRPNVSGSHALVESPAQGQRRQ